MKLFREHRRLLVDSLETTVEVKDIADMRNKIQAKWNEICPNYLSNIRIEKHKYKDPRLPKDWGGVSYYVVADFEGYKGQCIGMCNFFEK